MVKLEIEKPPNRNWTVDINLKFGGIMEKIKDWYNALTGATKFMFILAIIFTTANILLIAIITINSNEIIDASNSSVFSQEKSSLFAMFGLNDLFSGLKQGFRSAVLIVFNALGYYISLYIGKLLGFFKSYIELFTDILLDGWGYFAIMLYNVASLFFDILTITSFITAI